MLVTNGSITRNIAVNQLPEYVAKGYTEVKEAVKPATKTTKAKS